MSITLELPADAAKLIERYAAEHHEDLSGYASRLLARALAEEQREEASAGRDAARLAEPKLAALWDSPEEDAAWSHL